MADSVTEWLDGDVMLIAAVAGVIQGKKLARSNPAVDGPFIHRSWNHTTARKQKLLKHAKP